jgi:hypothetical protein
LTFCTAHPEHKNCEKHPGWILIGPVGMTHAAMLDWI